MNRENLQRMADHIKTIPEDAFDMSAYRYANHISSECNTIGCAIGHCTVLDDKELPRFSTGGIDFAEWSKDFTGLVRSDGSMNMDAWAWCFSAEWAHVDDTPLGASQRIEWLLEHGLPHDWEDQMEGATGLCYIYLTTTIMTGVNSPKYDNLQKMADYIKAIPQEMFDMANYRKFKGIGLKGKDAEYRYLNVDVECGSVGCVIGHCVILDENVDHIPRLRLNNIDYKTWSERFTGLLEKSSAWHWCFGSLWATVDNTTLGASKRIEYYIKNGIPNNWLDQLYGKAPLSYV